METQNKLKMHRTQAYVEVYDWTDHPVDRIRFENEVWGKGGFAGANERDGNYKSILQKEPLPEYRVQGIIYARQSTINENDGKPKEIELIKIAFEKPSFDLEYLGGVLENTAIFKSFSTQVIDDTGLRFNRMNLEVRQAILNSLSPEARKCLESILNIGEQQT